MAARIALTLTLTLGELACTRSDGAPAGSAAAPIATVKPPAAPERREKPDAGARERALAEYVSERTELVATLARDGIRDRRVLRALENVPRHRFVPETRRDSAYEDRPLPIGWGQTISQPHVVAAMTEAVAPGPGESCLEIGTGSGYQAAVLSELCARVYSIEYLPEVARFGGRNLAALGYRVELRQGDGYVGWPEAAPFDVIVVTAAPERVPEPLLAQLAVGGRLVIPVGPEHGVQQLELWRRVAAGSGAAAFERRVLSEVRFVPFLGESRQRGGSEP
jgi:protein-L-isoaspartate(D-aspartate) O-methyltransferase